MTLQRRKQLQRVLFYLFLTVAFAYTVFPFYWAVNTSFMSARDLTAIPPVYAPTPPATTSWESVLTNGLFLAALRNSVIVASGATLLSLFVGSLAACAIGRFRFRGRRPLLYLILAMTMFPQIAVVGPLFSLVIKTGLYNTHLALILTYLLTIMPFTVWVLSSFFASLPRELEESAYVDGASPFQTFWKILLPLSAPGLVTTGLLAFITAWNEYLFALSFTVDEQARTVPVVVAQFSGSTEFEIPWGEIMAGSIIATGPLILLVFLFQRRIVSGMTAGAVKG
jgi:trehalose/maltose transport system permease protein